MWVVASLRHHELCFFVSVGITLPIRTAVILWVPTFLCQYEFQNKGPSVRDETVAANKEKIGSSDIKPTREMDQSVQKRMQIQALRPINSSIKKWCNHKRGPCQFICAVQKIIQQQASDWSIFCSKERYSSKYLLFEQTTNQHWSALVDKKKKE